MQGWRKSFGTARCHLGRFLTNGTKDRTGVTIGGATSLQLDMGSTQLSATWMFHPIVFRPPLRLSDSAWHHDIPFAFLLMARAPRPSLWPLLAAGTVDVR